MMRKIATLCRTIPLKDFPIKILKAGCKFKDQISGIHWPLTFLETKRLVTIDYSKVLLRKLVNLLSPKADKLFGKYIFLISTLNHKIASHENTF